MNSVFDFVFWSETNARTVPMVFLSLLLFSIALRALLVRKSAIIKNIPFLLITITLVSLEIVKQIREWNGGYLTFRAVPLYYSSIFLYIYPVAHFSWGKFSRFMKGIAGTTSTVAGYFLLLNPSDVIGDHSVNFFTSFPDFHNVFYHFALLAYALLFLLLEVHEPNPKKDLKRLFITFAIYSLIAGIAANLLQTNYNSFYTSGFPPIEALRQHYVEVWGLLPTQIIYVFMVFLSMVFFGSVAYTIYFFMTKVLQRIRKKVDSLRSSETKRKIKASN